jgi:general stress protein 26
MPTPQEIETQFWKALKSDRTVMLGLNGLDDAHARPMTAQIERDGSGPIWFFTAKDNRLVQSLGSGAGRALCTFSSKDHELFASVHGTLHIDTDRAVVERLWNPFVAAWYEGGKADPKLVLLRLDPERGEIWLNESSLFAGIKMLLGADPKKDFRDKVAQVDLR